MNAKSGESGYDSSIYGNKDDKNAFLDYIPDDKDDGGQDIFNRKN